jgi:hypothetical protein
VIALRKYESAISILAGFNQIQAMAYPIDCPTCGAKSRAKDIVDLIKRHCSERHMIRCLKCGSDEAGIPRTSALQERGQVWQRFVRGIVPVRTASETYSPYVSLLSREATGEIDMVQISYYKDVRRRGGKLKHGHGPGGTPVLSKKQLLGLVADLREVGVLSTAEIIQAAGVPSSYHPLLEP